ncbi:MarR family winged helix-turn-helix transcriptional regulator [Segnochrobactraceae bacterium EtOH-i3]
MADVIARAFSAPSSASDDPASPEASPAAASGAAGMVHIDLIELLFFAYRDFVGGPDTLLSEYGFGRAHHRVVHFVNRNPGIRVTDLLDILKITKQSLGRVLKQLVDTGFIDQRPGPIDRRQRLLYATEKGQELDTRMTVLQSRRIEQALAPLSPEGREAARRFLLEIVDAADRDSVARMTERPWETAP